MEPRDEAPPGEQMQPGGMPGMMGRRQRPPISSQRRKQLLAFAMSLVEQVEQQTEPHERCLLNTMVRGILEPE